jgi:hypothetical protein
MGHGVDTVFSSNARRLNMLSVAALVMAEQVKVAVPQETLSLFGYFIGEWRIEGTSPWGPVSGTNTWKWGEGKHCITYESLWTDGAVTAQGVALCGWDQAKQQLVETEYWTDNSTNTLRYSKTNDSLWEGTMVGVDDKGRAVTAKIAYEFKSPTHLIFRATDFKIGGKPEKDVVLQYSKK